MRVSKTIEIAMAHVLDLPYDSKCNHLHGHNYKFTVIVEGEQDESGMVIDYSDLTDVMKKVLDQWDHKFLTTPDRIDLTTTLDGMVRATYPRARVWLPESDFVIIHDAKNTTAENIARHFWRLMKNDLELLDYEFDNLGVRVQETDKTMSEYWGE